METSIAQLIVQMVSPAVMVSACGLMLLSLGNKYARVVDRIRLFAAEIRAIEKLGDAAAVSDMERMRTLDLQIPDLFRRGRLLRNAVLFYHTAVMLFVACSFGIPLVRFGVPVWLPLVLFCVGMGSVLAATVLAWRETLLSFRLINLEVSLDRDQR